MRNTNKTTLSDLQTVLTVCTAHTSNANAVNFDVYHAIQSFCIRMHCRFALYWHNCQMVTMMFSFVIVVANRDSCTVYVVFVCAYARLVPYRHHSFRAPCSIFWMECIWCGLCTIWNWESFWRVDLKWFWERNFWRRKLLAWMGLVFGKRSMHFDYVSIRFAWKLCLFNKNSVHEWGFSHFWSSHFKWFSFYFYSMRSELHMEFKWLKIENKPNVENTTNLQCSEFLID